MKQDELNYKEKLLLYNELSKFLTDDRKQLFEKTVKQRTNFFSMVIENIHKSQNASAIVRTADCLGVQKLSIIENNNSFETNEEISLGASKWVTITKYNKQENNTKACFDDLRLQGYKIVATMPYKNDIFLDDLPIDNKMAIVFGSEVDGISNEAIKNADTFMKIPMYGFTESFNISVSAAITMHYLTNKLRKSNIPWQMNEEQQLDTLIQWTLKTIKYPDMVEKEVLNRLNFSKKSL